MINDFKRTFFNIYQQEPDACYFAPGRVNLIGEHIDYNGGWVMPCAINAGTWLLVRFNNESLIRLHSHNFSEHFTVPVGKNYPKKANEWFYYPLGVIEALQQKFNLNISGLDLYYFGNIPVGAGLSSSASIEVLTAYGISDIFKLNTLPLDIVKLTQHVENLYIGVQSGIMDQFAVTYGQKNKAILLNCSSLQHQTITCNLGDYNLAVINTNKTRKLEDSKYNERVQECNSVLKILQSQINIQYLCDINPTEWLQYQYLVEDKTLLKRATHVITENERVKNAVVALKEGDLDYFGKLMFQSHLSLKDDYEVTGVELDTIIDFCTDHPDVIGARMTGAGFGGCAIALLKKGKEKDFTKELNSFYKEKIGYHPDVYIQEIGDGPTKIF
ncbi:galactokinase [Pedobacter montanisoli]|uniref:Galactokinase n=1 Tax=Pedobacter montanisoli TaxID=2923277 RepID=A0ABS9ZY48_9SPHI|nr:galactokinase [Pedobacter montanisoli]MCJ0743236.1 galactokinase [Pedobacter montanisoli]